MKLCGVDTDLLQDALPMATWEEAVKQANRSPLMTFKTGAVIFTKDHDIISKGVSHVAMYQSYPGRSLHAEDHAIRQLKETNSNRGILIVTLGRAGNFTYSSRPCFNCSTRISINEIDWVYFLEKTNEGEWVVNCETADSLFRRSSPFAFSQGRLLSCQGRSRQKGT